MTDAPHNDEDFRKQLARKERSERILGLLLFALAAAWASYTGCGESAHLKLGHDPHDNRVGGERAIHGGSIIQAASNHASGDGFEH